ncbi:MAG: 3-hydroxyacyl-[acyl-carrier-protein] dehydratase [Paracoccaceae bacterium]|jgi:3-hydroxyacyl-[acyl-carrier-protein] dehydratase
MPIIADIELIQRLIPHRYPFLLVDKIKDIVLNSSAIGIKNVTFNEPQFQGHFPGKPLFPGVQMIEALAQTAGCLVALSMDLIDRNLLVYFMTVDCVKFRRKVGPGDVLELHVSVKRGGGKVWKFAGRAMVGDELACECEFTAMMELPQSDAKA